MKEFNGFFLFAIFGFLTVIAVSTTLSIYAMYPAVGNILVVAIFLLFFAGLYGLAFSVQKEK